MQSKSLAFSQLEVDRPNRFPLARLRNIRWNRIEDTEELPIKKLRAATRPIFPTNPVLNPNS